MKCVTQYNKTMGLRAGGLGFFFFIILLFLNNNKVHWIWYIGLIATRTQIVEHFAIVHSQNQ